NTVPRVNLTLKYERLGPMAIENHRWYCEHHGYNFIDEVPVNPDRPASWAKVPAILRALEDHRWVVWADSDTLVFNTSFDLRNFCDARFDVVAQCPVAYLQPLGWTTEHSLEAMRLNTGVFMVRNSRWSRDLLETSYAQKQFISSGEVWNGIGEQEAILEVLRQYPEDFHRIHYVQNLQSHPKCRSQDDIFVHFYGNHARHRIPESECLEVIQRWEQCVRQRRDFPDDIARFHWSCIQNKSQDGHFDRGGPERFFYSQSEIGIT
ncbi:MAG: hypothetical protein OEY57_13250, partial [Nitrospirota bacterium]|nr:hypothetical protein [Nitrospirota bacterium]